MQSYVATNPFIGDITLTGDWSGFTGDLNLSSPAAQVNRVAANLGGTFVPPDATANVSIASGTTLWLSGTGQDFPSAVSISGTGNAEGRGALRLDSINVSGPVTLTADATIGSSSGTVDQSITGIIGGSHQLATALNGGRNIILSGDNDYSGGTLIQGCPLEAQHAHAFGTGSVTVASTATGSAGRAVIGDAITVANDFEITGLQGGTGRGLLEGPIAGVGTVTGSINITTTPTNGGHFASTGGILDLQGPITASVPVIVRSGTVKFSGGGTYSAVSVITGNAQLGTSNGICTSAVVDLASGGAAELDLNGSNQQLAGLTSTGTNPATVTTSSTSAVLTIDSSGTHDYAGDISGDITLVKSGSGTQTLSGALSYSGDTTVSSGTISLGSSNEDNDASTVTIAASGATLGLAFSGTDTVNQLFIGSTQMPAGDYTSAHVSGVFSGVGTLHVTSGPSGGYSAWQSANAPGQTVAQDHDNDGVQNGIEYFMGVSGNGLTANSAINGAHSITWPMGATYSGTYGTDYLIQTSSDLATWTPVSVGDVAITPGTSLSYTLTGTGKRFVRLLVNPN
jgi:autotransporter-associated beta strand protein